MSRPACQPQDRSYIKAKPVDVEDWGMLTMTFSDGTKGTVFSGDMIMGGVRNLVETYTSGGSLFANITPNNHMMSYLTDEEKLASVYITEKVDRKTGWQYICLEEEWTRGYLQEIQDFMECVATRPAAARRPRPRLRDDQGELRRLLGGGRRAADCAVDCVRCAILIRPGPPWPAVGAISSAAACRRCPAA